MKNESSNESSEIKDIPAEDQVEVLLSPSMIRFWNDLQRKFHGEGLAFIDFRSTIPEDHYWHLHMDDAAFSFSFTRKQRDLIGGYESLYRANVDLYFIFHSYFTPTGAFWDKIENKIKIKGFFIPDAELLRLDNDHIVRWLTHLNLMRKYFPFASFLRELKEISILPENASHPLPILAIWEFFVAYARCLHTAPAHQLPDFPVTDFEQQLPFEQLTTLLFTYCRQFYDKSKDASRFTRLLANACPEVQFFWKYYNASLLHHFKFGFEESTESNKESTKNFSYLNKPFSAINRIRNAFFEIYLDHVNIFTHQAILELTEKENESLSFGKKVKQFLGGRSVLDRIRDATDKKINRPFPIFRIEEHKWLPEKGPKWFIYSKEERDTYLEEFYKNISDANRKIFEEQAIHRQLIFLGNLADKITTPFFHWVPTEQGLIPNWNLIKPWRAKKMEKAFAKKRKQEKLEAKRLEEKLAKLATINDPSSLEIFLLRTSDFNYSIYQQQWEREVERQKKAVKHRTAYRTRKMRELGILEPHEQPTSRMEVWLDEMLQIEKEIARYVLFVKKVFQSALPIRRSVEFDPYRHSSDGIEFDPDTVQDTDKWMTGDVMKTLRMKVDRADAEQINAFALDSSGSMTHEKMRNLFKILYLLVLGLEDRKTYDAFHFFSTFFIEAADFTNQYTNRTLLFKVLRKISFIQRGKVSYGGNGGTNISQGIFECHDRMKAFAEKIQKEKPDTTFLKSIFVLTDGEPTMGIFNLEELSEAIEARRKDGDVAIKGLFLKPKLEENFWTGRPFMEDIFGKDEFVETDEIMTAINEFVYIMSLTYKQQRKALKQAKKAKKHERKS